MEQITRVLVLCVIAALTGLLLRKSNPEIALLLALAAAVTVLMQLAAPVRELFDFLKRLTGTVAYRIRCFCRSIRPSALH